MKVRRSFDLRIRCYPEDFRQHEQEIGNLLVPSIRGTKIPIKEIADIKRITGPSIIYRDDHTRYGAIKFSRAWPGYGCSTHC